MPLIYKEWDIEYGTCDAGIPFERCISFSFYDSDSPLDEFVDWLLVAFDKKYDTVIYSHNGGKNQ